MTVSFNTTEEEQTTREKTEKGECLSDSIRHSLQNYFSRLGGEGPRDIYDMILSETELPLFEFLIHHTKNNHVKMSKYLGLSRGTVRQKLKKHGMLERSPKKISK